MECPAGTHRPGVDGRELSALLAKIKTAEQARSRSPGRLAGSRAYEAVEGLPLDHCLSLAVRMLRVDARALVGAGEILADSPHRRPASSRPG